MHSANVTIVLIVNETLFVFFFFQAEDGIRDDLVTGVQTCALPICDGDPAARCAACVTRSADSGVLGFRASRRARRSSGLQSPTTIGRSWRSSRRTAAGSPGGSSGGDSRHCHKVSPDSCQAKISPQAARAVSVGHGDKMPASAQSPETAFGKI